MKVIGNKRIPIRGLGIDLLERFAPETTHGVSREFVRKSNGGGE